MAHRVWRRQRLRAAVVLFVQLLIAGEVRGQSTDDINASLQFNFTNPGARSLGLGGAFTARADDATAVYANPAGLVQLSRPEVSIELRRWELASVFLDGGVQASAETFDGLTFAETADSFDDVSFLSSFYPGRSGRWVVGLFAHRLARFETEIRSDGASVCCSPLGDRLLARPIDGVYDLDIETLGLSAAGRLSENLSLGGTLSIARFDLRSRTERLDDHRAVAEEPPPGLEVLGDPAVCCELGSSQFAVIYFETQRAVDDNRDVAYNLGLLWQSTRTVAGVPLLSLGAVYRRGPEFEFVGNTHLRFDTTPISYRSAVMDPQHPDECKQPGRDGCPGIFKVPDVFGFGLSVRPAADWLVALDYNRVQYSDLTDQMLDIVSADSALSKGERGKPADFLLDDGNELRLGVEYALVRERRYPDFFLRAGAWYDPDHKLRYVGDRPAQRAVWAPGDDELHYAAGGGLRYPRFQIDLAVDVSERINTLSLSTVFFFGGS